MELHDFIDSGVELELPVPETFIVGEVIEKGLDLGNGGVFELKTDEIEVHTFVLILD